MPRALTPAPVSARAQARKFLPFGFGPRFFFLLVTGFVWLIPVWWTPSLAAVLFLWDALALAIFCIDLWRLPVPSDLRASRTWLSPLTLTHPTSVEVEIENLGRIAVHVRILDQAPPSMLDEPAPLAAMVPPASTQTLQYAVIPRERGDANAGKLFIRYRSLLGFAERWASVPLEQTVTVLPDLAQAHQQALYVLRTRHSGLEKQKRRYTGFGREFESLRDYREGDELRDVSWTATARRAQLITRAYTAERSQTVWVMVDAGRLLRARIREDGSERSLTKLDYSVNAALSVAQVALLQGDQVGLLAYGRSVRQVVPPARGSSYLRPIIDALANVRGEAREADHGRAARTLMQKQSRRALVLWITDFPESAGSPDIAEYAALMSRKHLVVLAAISQPDLTALAQKTPQSQTDMFHQAAALELVDRREVLIRQLRESGILAVDLEPHRITAALVSEYLRVKDRSLI